MRDEIFGAIFGGVIIAGVALAGITTISLVGHALVEDHRQTQADAPCHFTRDTATCTGSGISCPGSSGDAVQIGSGCFIVQNGKLVGIPR